MPDTFDLSKFEDLFRPRAAGPPSSGLPGVRLCQIKESRKGLVLGSIGGGFKYEWQPGMNEAKCHVPHIVPRARCGCGLYACTDIVSLTETLTPPFDNVLLCGVVARGRIIEFERGWRAQYAEIVAVTDTLPSRIVRDMAGKLLTIQRRSNTDPAALAEVSLRYDVPAVSLAGLEDFMQSLGGSDDGSRQEG
jgi:hypothetical protein